MIYTIGHSTLDKQKFIELIRPIQVVIDVRSHPTSRWEQFRKENLEHWLPRAEKQYEWWPSLGGWTDRHLPLMDEMKPRMVDIRAYARGKFPKQRIGKNFPHPDQLELPLDRPSWTNQGLWDYSWFMALDEFLDAVDILIQRGSQENVGIMCCECLWWKCHRSMIADYLCFKEVDVIHLQPKPKRHSAAIGNRLDRYHPDIIKVWNQRQ
jgi:hypothetical protein